MLRELLRNGFSFETVVGLCSTIFVVFCTMPIHEYAHALAAVKLGDPTPRQQGRLTLRPMAHLDLWGCLLILLVGFGYAKPVQVNMRNFKNPKAGMAIVALAGPASNLIMAFVFLILRAAAITLLRGMSGSFVNVLSVFLYYAAYINISLAVFNFLPIPPLDGSRIATALLPNRVYYTIMQYERYIMIALFVLLLTGLLTTPLGWLSTAVLRGLNWLAILPFQALIG